MNVDEYLARIDYRGPQEPSVNTLQMLHRAHMLTVPFENLDIPLEVPIILSIPSLYNKIVQRRRGGFCYELNGLFGWLLEHMGFRVVTLGALVIGGSHGMEFDHLILLVELEERWIADVGFGDSFLEPLQLDSVAEHVQVERSYRLKGTENEKVFEERIPGKDWEPQYVFSLIPRRLEDFSPVCMYIQTSPESNFTQKTICSLATEDGRISLSNNRIIVTVGEHREERQLVSEQEYRTILATKFGINLGHEARIDKLMTFGDGSL